MSRSQPSNFRNETISDTPNKRKNLKGMPEAERFYSYVTRTDSCWYWLGTTIKGGYGTFRRSVEFGGAKILAHRYSYSINKGDIPTNLEIDHLCKTRNCVNPDHLEAVTRTVNIQRSKRNVCPRGHVYDELRPGNQYGRFKRSCSLCRRESQRKAQQKRRSRYESVNAIEI